MGRIFFTFVLTSAFWIWYYSDYAKVEDGESKQASTEVMPSESNATTPAPSKQKEVAKPAKATPAATQQSTTTAKPIGGVVVTSQPQEQREAATPKTEGSAAVPTQLSIANLYGKWQPIEGAKLPLELTKYGAAIQTEYGIKMRYAYSVNGERMRIRYDNAQFKLLHENGAVYLEIYNSSDFSGRYKKIANPNKIEATVLAKSDYSTLIVGKWTPIDGQYLPIEFTKFGTVIQTEYSIDMRYDYTLNEDKMVIRYDKNARVVISEDAKYYYLELYNTTDFSGRYRKTK